MNGKQAKRIRYAAKQLLLQASINNNTSFEYEAEDVVDENIRRGTRFSRVVKDSVGITVGYNNFSGRVQYSSGMKRAAKHVRQQLEAKH